MSDEQLRATGGVHEQDAWRLEILNKGSAALSVLLLVWIVFAARQPIMTRSTVLAAAMYGGMLFIIAAASWRAGPYPVRILLLLIGILSVQAAGVLRVGYVLGPALLGIMAVILSGLLVGVAWAMGAWVLSTLIFLAAAVLMGTGVVPSSFDPSTVDPRDIRVGIRFTISYATLTVPSRSSGTSGWASICSSPMWSCPR